MNGTIFDIKHYAIHDGPGIRQTIFFKGCPLSCWWCHNPESCSPLVAEVLREENIDGVSVCEKETIGKIYTIDQLLYEIEKDRVFFEQSNGGVTLSGGEPLQQYDFALQLLKECNSRDLHTCVDTSGHISNNKITEIAEYTNLFLYDLKHIDNNQHIKYTGVSNKQILSNLRLLDSIGKEIWIRYPLIPGVNDDESELLKLMELLSKLENTHPLSILPYHKIGSHKYEKFGIDYKMNGIEEPDNEYIGIINRRFIEAGFKLNNG